MPCGRCGYDNPEDARYCAICGGELMEAPGEARVDVGTLPCPLCGFLNEEIAAYCRSCGKKMKKRAYRKAAAKPAPVVAGESPPLPRASVQEAELAVLFGLDSLDAGEASPVAEAGAEAGAEAEPRPAEVLEAEEGIGPKQHAGDLEPETASSPDGIENMEGDNDDPAEATTAEVASAINVLVKDLPDVEIEESGGADIADEPPSISLPPDSEQNAKSVEDSPSAPRLAELPTGSWFCDAVGYFVLVTAFLLSGLSLGLWVWYLFVS